jgi:hypothetical protein
MSTAAIDILQIKIVLAVYKETKTKGEAFELARQRGFVMGSRDFGLMWETVDACAWDAA